MKTIYRADDGREFTTKEECEEYEKPVLKKYRVCMPKTNTPPHYYFYREAEVYKCEDVHNLFRRVLSRTNWSTKSNISVKEYDWFCNILCHGGAV